MTQETSLPSPPAENVEPPQYNNEGAPHLSRFVEKEQQSVSPCPPQQAPSTTTTNPPLTSTSKPCTHYPTSPTPFLDAYLTSSTAKNAVQSLNTTLEDLIDSDHCTRCTANEAARTLTRYLFEMRQANKAGDWRKEDKKAMKVELKGLMREIQGVVREEKAKLKAEGGKAK